MATQMSVLQFILCHACIFPFTATQNPIKLFRNAGSLIICCQKKKNLTNIWAMYIEIRQMIIY